MTPTKTKTKRVTMNDDREQAIYGAVYDEIMRLRIELQRQHRDVITSDIDTMISKAGDRAGIAAIRAAGGEGK